MCNGVLKLAHTGSWEPTIWLKFCELIVKLLLAFKINHEETVSLNLTKATNEEFFFSQIACMSVLFQLKKFKN